MYVLWAIWRLWYEARPSFINKFWFERFFKLTWLPLYLTNYELNSLSEYFHEVIDEYISLQCIILIWGRLFQLAMLRSVAKFCDVKFCSWPISTNMRSPLQLDSLFWSPVNAHSNELSLVNTTVMVVEQYCDL